MLTLVVKILGMPCGVKVKGKRLNNSLRVNNSIVCLLMVEWPDSNCRQINNAMQNTNNIGYRIVKQDSTTTSGNVDP